MPRLALLVGMRTNARGCNELVEQDLVRLEQFVQLLKVFLITYMDGRDQVDRQTLARSVGRDVADDPRFQRDRAVLVVALDANERCRIRFRLPIARINLRGADRCREDG